MPIHQLVYASEATVPMSAEALREILVQARVFNHTHRLTGILFYSDGTGEKGTGTFVQILEGDETAIRALLTRIRLDPRNVRLQVLADGPAPQRMFPDWAMAFATVEPQALASLTGYIDPRSPRFLLPRAHGMSPELHKFVQSY